MTRTARVSGRGLTADPEFLAALEIVLAEIGPVEIPDPISIGFLRQMADRSFPIYGRLIPTRDDVVWQEFSTPRPTGSRLNLRWYTREDRDESLPGPAALYIHGGGMVSGDLDGYHPIIARYVGESGTSMLAVDYRLAPEHPAPAALEDCLLALEWLHASASELGVDPTRVGVMGDSGGGAVAAAFALAARDGTLPALAAQILAYPMLDDRTREPDELLTPFVTWTYASNAVAWDAVLGGQDADESGHIAPARAADLSGLPPTYLDTGELDIFRAEIVDYAQRLSAAGVSTELHVHPGVPHAFEIAAPQLAVSQRVLRDRFRALARL